MPGITLDEVNKQISSWITDEKNCVIVVTAPEKEGVSVPTEDAIKSIFKTVNGTTLTKYTDKVSDKPLTNTALVPGKVTKESTDAENGITSWTLSNGAKVVFKQTDFKNDQILLMLTAGEEPRFILMLILFQQIMPMGLLIIPA